MVEQMSPADMLVYFVREREAIRQNKEDYNREAPWTEDPILREYRFCNVRREDDRVTRWIADNWRKPNKGDPDLWFAMVVARFINWPPTLMRIGYPVPWDEGNFLAGMADMQASGRKVYTSAYMITSNKDWQGKPKQLYLATIQFTPLWKARDGLRPRPGDTLTSWHMTIGAFYDLGSFMAAQIVADLKYVDPHLLAAPDWHTFAASGPGSRRGLNRVLERRVDSPWQEDAWRQELGRLRDWLNGRLKWAEPLHAQDVQNCLCEFDKYARVRAGWRPRARYSHHVYA